eukprot:9291794-Prorocentrum_lima.AAC.1
MEKQADVFQALLRCQANGDEGFGLGDLPRPRRVEPDPPLGEALPQQFCRKATAKGDPHLEPGEEGNM